MSNNVQDLLIEPTEKEINGRKYWLGKIPAVQGREILTQYPSSAMPKLGDYQTNKSLMLQMMSFVAVETAPGVYQKLDSENLVNNHVKDAQTLIRLEWEMFEFNFSFFASGKLSKFLAGLLQKVQPSMSKMLTESLAQFVQKTQDSTKN